MYYCPNTLVIKWIYSFHSFLYKRLFDSKCVPKYYPSVFFFWCFKTSTIFQNIWCFSIFNIFFQVYSFWKIHYKTITWVVTIDLSCVTLIINKDFLVKNIQIFIYFNYSLRLVSRVKTSKYKKRREWYFIKLLTLFQNTCFNFSM